MKQAELLQRHLTLFRSCTGWTAQDLANQLEVSRQTVSAWENYNVTTKKGVKLSAGYYLAIRKLLDDEIAMDISDDYSKKKQHILGTLLEILVDHPDQYTSDDVDAALKEAELLAPSIMKQPEQRKTVSKIWPALLIGCGAAVSIALMAILGHKDD